MANRIQLFWVIITILFGAGNRADAQPLVVSNALWIISNPQTRTNEFVDALRVLRNSSWTNEPPEFWSRIANSTSFPSESRRRAFLQLFERHFRSGMTLPEVGRMIDHPKWIRRRDIIPFGSGAAPMLISDNAGFWLIVLGEDDRKQLDTIFFRFRDGSPRDPYSTLAGVKPVGGTVGQETNKIAGIVSEERPQNGRTVFNAFGIPPLIHTNDGFGPSGDESWVTNLSR
jgi:hypothetical protein